MLDMASLSIGASGLIEVKVELLGHCSSNVLSDWYTDKHDTTCCKYYYIRTDAFQSYIGSLGRSGVLAKRTIFALVVFGRNLSDFRASVGLYAIYNRKPAPDLQNCYRNASC